MHTSSLLVGCATWLRRGVVCLCALAVVLAEASDGLLAPDSPRASCLSECTPRFGILSAFGAEADLLLAGMQDKREWWIRGNRFTTGQLAGQSVVVALTGVSLVNASMVTQQMLDHFRIGHLLLSGIAGGIDPEGQVGDVAIPARWALPMEAWWGADGRLPDPCGTPGELACLGLHLRSVDGTVLPDFRIPLRDPAGHPPVSTGLLMRENFVRTPATGLAGEFRADFPVDAEMLDVATHLTPGLEQCGPREPKLCVSAPPRLRVGGVGVSVPVFLANGDYRAYLWSTLQARVLDMETAAVAEIAYANAVPFLATRSVSDLAGGSPSGDVGALFRSGLAESNAARVTQAFLAAWAKHAPAVQPIAVAASRGAARAATGSAGARSDRPAPRAIKVLIITMFAPEAEPWLKPLALDETVAVPGLSPDFPVLHCNHDDVCLMTTGMGHANAAASTMAVALDPQLDLRQTWFLVAGIAGIDPATGSPGSAAWARYLVDFGIAQELDARERPPAWRTGYLPVMGKSPEDTPRFEYHTEVFTLDARLTERAFALSRAVSLEDTPQAAAYRHHYREPAAQAPPAVLMCDTLGGDTWWHGRLLGEHARDWMRLLTKGGGHYCTTQQEDNATAAALSRGAAAGRLDAHRLAVLRSAANFDRPYQGQTAFASLRADSGGFLPATHNLYRVGSALVRDIVARWPEWSQGVPER